MQKPYSYGAFPEYAEGFNACSAGIGLEANPYPVEHMGLSKYNLWCNGWNDYTQSPYYCIANNAYIRWKADGFKHTLVAGSDIVETTRELDDPSTVPGTEDIGESYSIERWKFKDGSALVFTPGFIHVEGKDGVPFIQTSRPKV